MHRLLLCVLLLLLPPLALAAPQYELVDLGTELRLVALEPGGAALGQIGLQAAVIRRGQAPQLLPFLADGLFATARAGRDGKIVGESGTGRSSLETHAALWQGATVRDLGTLGGPELFSSATALTATQMVLSQFLFEAF